MKEQATLPAVLGTKSAQTGQHSLLIFLIIQQKKGREGGRIDRKTVFSCKFLLSGLVFSAFEGYYKQKTHVKQTR